MNSNEYKEYLEIQVARLEGNRKKIYKELLEGNRTWKSETSKKEFIEFLKDVEGDEVNDKDIITLIKKRKNEKDKLIVLLKNFKLITDDDLI